MFGFLFRILIIGEFIDTVRDFALEDQVSEVIEKTKTPKLSEEDFIPMSKKEQRERRNMILRQMKGAK